MYSVQCLSNITYCIVETIRAMMYHPANSPGHVSVLYNNYYIFNYVLFSLSRGYNISISLAGNIQREFRIFVSYPLVNISAIYGRLLDPGHWPMTRCVQGHRHFMVIVYRPLGMIEQQYNWLTHNRIPEPMMVWHYAFVYTFTHI